MCRGCDGRAAAEIETLTPNPLARHTQAADGEELRARRADSGRVTDLERLRGEEESEGRQTAGEESRWWSVLSVASWTGRVSTHQGSRAGPEDGGADGDRLAAGVCALSGRKP